MGQRFVDYPAVLAAVGVHVDVVAGWRDRTAPGDFDPVGVTNHHTAGSNSLGQIVGANLAQLYIPKSGRVVVCSARKASHAGRGVQRVLDRTRDRQAPLGDARATYGPVAGVGATSGNGHYIGIEVENLGDGRDPYPPAQVAAVVATNAAILRHLGRPAACAIMHREWTARKIDIRWSDRPIDLRAAVAAAIIRQNAAPASYDLSTLPAPGISYEEDDVQTQLVTLAHRGFGRFVGAWNPGFGRDPVVVGVTLHGPAPDRTVGGYYDSGDGWWEATEHMTPRAQARAGHVIITASMDLADKPANLPVPDAINVFVSVA